MWCTYILKSSRKRWYYVGSTNRIQNRVAEHNAGSVRSTKSHTPLILVYTKQFRTESEARKYEHLLKDKRLEKERIIRHIEKDCGFV